MRNKEIKIARNTQNWWGFTLQRGHAFGLYDGVCYVSAGEPCAKKVGHIIVYKQVPDRANYKCYNWLEISIPDRSELGRLMLNALYSSPYDGVMPKDPHYDTHSEWKKIHRYRQSLPKSASARPKKAADYEGKDCHYDDRRWNPYFSTFRSKRADRRPMPPVVRPPKTWVDQIIAREMRK